MCIAVVAWRVQAAFPLVLAANRDESHDRAAAPLERWDGSRPFFAGRDLCGGGTWLGVDLAGRFALLTTCRIGEPGPALAPSRGALVPSFLAGALSAEDFLAALAARAADYAAFNLMIADERCLWYASNRMNPFARLLTAGVYGLGNQLLDTPSPKLLRLRRRFDEWLWTHGGASPAALFEMLADTERGPREEGDSARTLPPDLIDALSATFVRHPTFGTRCSTVALVEPRSVLVAERCFDASGTVSGETTVLRRLLDTPAHAREMRLPQTAAGRSR